MKRDTIREKSERGREHGKKHFTAAKLRQLLATFFFCASKIAFTHSAKLKKRKKKSNKTQILLDLHFKGQLNHV